MPRKEGGRGRKTTAEGEQAGNRRGDLFRRKSFLLPKAEQNKASERKQARAEVSGAERQAPPYQAFNISARYKNKISSEKTARHN